LKASYTFHHERSDVSYSVWFSSEAT